MRLTYSNGASGVVDLSHLADRGVFRLWSDPASFRSVRIGPGGELHWSDDVELCGDALYMQVTGKAPKRCSTISVRVPCMPEISRFYGIVIKMYHEDHEPPHFPAEYAGEQAVFAIDDLRVVAGRIRKRAASLVAEWAALHQAELQAIWEQARSQQPLDRIDPLS